MFILVTGGSGSGKSAYAEEQIVLSGAKRRYYIATMFCQDAESKKRVDRHRHMREGKHFETIEQPLDLQNVEVEKGSAVLLECMSNLAANEIFADGKVHKAGEVSKKILAGIEKLKETCECLVVVTNEVFSDGAVFDSEMQEYMECLGTVNRKMAVMADQVVEVVYSIPVILKKEERKA